MEIILSYGLTDKDGKQWNGGAAEVYRPKASSAPRFMADFAEAEFRYHHDSTYVVALTDGRSIHVFWNAELFGDRLDVKSLASGPCILAAVDAFGQYDLVVRSEPTMDGRLGVTVSNREGKVLLLGMGDIVRGAKGYHFVAHGRETFQWRAASPSACAHTNYAVRNPGTTPTKVRMK